MKTATIYTETVNGLTFHLADHGDHVTTGAETPCREWAYIISQPQQARDGSTVWTANLWFRGNLVASSPRYTPTAGTAAAAAFQVFSALLNPGGCDHCAATSVGPICDNCQEFFDEISADGYVGAGVSK